jgi:hypothetical protein
LSALRLELRPSYPLAAAIVAAHAAAGLSIGILVRGVPGGLLGAALLALGCAAAWSRALLRGRDAVRAVEVSGADLSVRLGDGRVVPVRVAPRRYVGRLLVTLRLGPPLSRTLLVVAGMLAPGELRRLRVWALWGRLPGVAGEQLAG